MKNEIWLTACHVPGVLNFEADKSSRQFNERIEWQLQPSIFLKITAFSFSWSGKFVYIFPPFSLLNRCLQKLENDKTLALLIAPVWPTQVWWPRLLSLLVANPLLLPQDKDFLILPQSGTLHPLRNQMRLMACLLSGNTMKQEEYRSQLLDCSWHPGEEVLRNNTPGTSKNGQLFVSKGKSIIFNHL